MTELVTTNRGYQKPRPGQKLKDDVLRLIAAFDAIDVDVAELLLALADKSDVGHGHGMDAIAGLVAALGNKLDVGHHDALGDLTDVDVAGAANGMALLRQAAKWIPVALQINNIAGLETALNSKATPADITTAINTLVAAAPGALDTLNELAAALGNDPAFAATVTAALAGRVAYTPQVKTAAEQGQARANIGAGVLDGFRNQFINPAWQIAQRGLTGSVAAGAQGFAGDRWLIINGTNQAVTWSITDALVYDFPQSGDAPGVLAMNFAVAPTTGQVEVCQKIEGAKTLSGKTVTLGAFFFTNAPASVNVAPIVQQNFGTGGGSAAVTINKGPLAFPAGVFTKLQEVFDLPGTAGKTFGNNHYLLGDFSFIPRHAASYQISSAFLVEGDARAESNPVAVRHVQQELALCQRYYELFRASATWVAEAASTTHLESAGPYKVEKRATPNITKISNGDSIFGNGAAVLAAAPHPNYFRWSLDGTLNGSTGTAHRFNDALWGVDAEI